MTKQEMVDKYNFFVRKRECYKLKIQANASLKQIVLDGLTNCNSSLNCISEYSDKADIFKGLYYNNYEMFNVYEVDRIMAIFDEIDQHLKGVKENAQSSINQWDYKIREYEEND